MNEDSKPWWWKVGAGVGFLLGMVGWVVGLWVLGTIIQVYRGG